MTSALFPHTDESVRPQDDLNRHVNGAWLATAQIPEDQDAYGAFHHLRDKAEEDVRAILEESAQAVNSPDTAQSLDPEFSRIQHRIGTFYAAFMDAERAEELKLAPIAEKLIAVDAADSPGELLRLSCAWQREGVSGLIGAGAVRDAGDPQRVLWHVMQDGLGLPDEAYYREETHAETLGQYEEHLVRLLALGGYGQEEAASAAADVVSLEKRLAGHHWDRVTLRDAQKRYNLKTRAEAEALMPLLAEAIDGWQLTDAQAAEIVVGQPDVLEGFQAALTQEPLETWKHWLRVNLLRSAAPLLHQAMVDEHFDFYGRTLNGTPQLKERWKRGVALTNAHLGEDVGQIYVDRHYPPEARAAMDELIDSLLQAYRQSISELDWMGEDTRVHALEKLGSFTPKIGFPNRWIDYSDVPVGPDAVENSSRASIAAWNRDVAKIDEGPDDEEWHMTPRRSTLTTTRWRTSSAFRQRSFSRPSSPPIGTWRRTSEASERSSGMRSVTASTIRAPGMRRTAPD